MFLLHDGQQIRHVRFYELLHLPEILHLALAQLHFQPQRMCGGLGYAPPIRCPRGFVNVRAHVLPSEVGPVDAHGI